MHFNYEQSTYQVISNELFVFTIALKEFIYQLFIFILTVHPANTRELTQKEIKAKLFCVNFQFRLVAEGFTVVGAIIYLVLEIKDVLITQGITAQLITLVSLLSYARLSQSKLDSSLPYSTQDSRDRALTDHLGFKSTEGAGSRVFSGKGRAAFSETVLRPPK